MVPDVHEISRHGLCRGGDDPTRVRHVHDDPLCRHVLACDEHPACAPEAMVNPDASSEGLHVLIAVDHGEPHQARCLGRNEAA